MLLTLVILQAAHLRASVEKRFPAALLSPQHTGKQTARLLPLHREPSPSLAEKAQGSLFASNDGSVCPGLTSGELPRMPLLATSCGLPSSPTPCFPFYLCLKCGCFLGCCARSSIPHRAKATRHRRAESTRSASHFLCS